MMSQLQQIKSHKVGKKILKVFRRVGQVEMRFCIGEINFREETLKKIKKINLYNI